MEDIKIDDVLFDKKVEVSKGKKTNKVTNVLKCPVCGCKQFIVADGIINKFICGTEIKVIKKVVDGKEKISGLLLNKCKYNVFHFYRETDYDPTVHYDTTYLENNNVIITGSCCMYHSAPVEMITDREHIKIYQKNGKLNLTGGTLVGTALIRKDTAEVRKVVEQYVQDYNDIVVDKNIWSWTVTDNRGNYVDSLLGFFGNVYEQAKEYMSEYGIYEEDYEKFWEARAL